MLMIQDVREILEVILPKRIIAKQDITVVSAGFRTFCSFFGVMWRNTMRTHRRLYRIAILI